MEKKENYVTQIQTALQSTKKHKAFTQTTDVETRFNIQIIKYQFIKQKDHYQKEKIKKVITLMKDELGKKIMTEFTALRPRTYSFLTNENDKKQKAQKSVS